jgi:hypothetical protein
MNVAIFCGIQYRHAVVPLVADPDGRVHSGQPLLTRSCLSDEMFVILKQIVRVTAIHRYSSRRTLNSGHTFAVVHAETFLALHGIPEW